MIELTASADPFARHAIALMKEYEAKLRKYRKRAQENMGRAKQASGQARTGVRLTDPVVFVRQHQALSQQFDKLKPAMLSLARIISQKLEHSEFDELTRLELTLRLAEFENTLRTTIQAMATLPA